MNCKHCGEKIAVFSRYCENCGQEAHSLIEWMKILGGSALKFLKKRLWLSIAVAGALVVAIVLCIIFGRPKYINPTDYVITHTAGFNGDGEILVEIDYDALCDDVLGKAPDPTTKEGYEKYAQYQTQAEDLRHSLSIIVDRNTNLQNGDFYMITMRVLDDTIYEEYGFSFKNIEYQKTLQVGTDSEPFDDYVTLNLFDFIGISLEGEDGNGELRVECGYQTEITFNSGKRVPVSIKCSEYWGGYILQIYFPNDKVVSIELNVDADYDLSNGDVVTLTLDMKDADALTHHGVVLKTYEQTFTISGLTENK